MTKIFTIGGFKPFIFLLFVYSCFIQINVNAQTIAAAYHKDPVIFINLMLPSGDSTLLVDGTAAMYDNKFLPSVDQYDANKLNNFLENICLFRDGENLAVEARPFPKQNDTLFINMWGLRRPAYDLQITIQGIPTLLALKAWLVDNYLHTKKLVNFFGKTLYSFLPNADSNSYKKRFMLVFSSEKQDELLVPAGNIKVFPNPVRGNKIGLQFSNMLKDNYSITLSSLSGEILLKTNIVHNGGNYTYYLPLNSVLAKGINSIVVYGSNAKKTIHLPIILSN